MKRDKKLTIGILVSGIMDDVTRSICQGVKQAAAAIDVDVIVLPGKYWERDLTDNRELMYEYQYNTIFSYARPETLDGLVVAADCIGCLTTKDRIEMLMKDFEGIPCVLVASKMDGYVGVSFDNSMGIDEGMKYLIKKVGHTHFGMIGGSSDNSDAQERKQAFIRNLEENGLPYDESMFVEGNLSRNCQDKAAELLDKNPGIEAVFCVNDETAIGLYEELRKRHLHPGKDISVLGYDDSNAAVIVDPSLSSVRADMGELGAEAFGMVLQMIDGKAVANRVVPTKFVLRNSNVNAGAANDEENNSKIDLDLAFNDIFYRYRHEANTEKLEALKCAFCRLFEKLQETFETDVTNLEDYQEIQNLTEKLLNMGAVGYADVENLLVFLEEIYRDLKRKQKNESRKFELRDFFSVIYRKIILAMNTMSGAAKEAENKSNYSMKLFIRDMLQFEKGNDQSYACLLGNLDWLHIRNAFLYTFDKPITHLDKERFVAPEDFYLKAYLQNGKVTAVPAIEQKLAFEDIFHNRFMKAQQNYNLVLFPLFSNEMLYGIMLCDLTESIFVNGEFLVNQFGAAAKMISLLRTNEQIQQQLEESLATLHENNIALDTLSKSDGLTGIFNRRGFYDAGEKMIAECKEKKENLLVVYVDMNNLKIINDRYGHEEGDFSLKLISDMLVKTVEGRGVAGRIGGDEYACIMHYHEEDDSNAILQSIYQSFDEFNENSEKEYNVTVSAGAYLLEPSMELSLAEALTLADEKLYEVKQLRKKSVAKKENKK
ncbi:MAG: GGDEF domain-containing protein [Lachnospiraceae bacterium]|nr:GGDEF domain-containing protein [Lachnospiraceae bacterium]